MRMSKSCTTCDSINWCGRECGHIKALRREAVEVPVPVAPAPKPKKPKSTADYRQITPLSDRERAVLERAQLQAAADAVVTKPRKPSAKKLIPHPDCPVCNARRVKNAEQMRLRRLGQK
jgi:hypothetical protein